MKISKESVLIVELSGEELKLFASVLEKVLMGESAKHLDIGILNEDEVKFIESLIKTIEKS